MSPRTETAERTISTSTGLLDRYLEGEGFLHRADARVKLAVTLGFIFAAASIPPGAWPAFAVMAAVVWSAAAASGVGLRRVFLRSLIAIPFILIALPTVFTKPGVQIFEIDLIAFSLGATGAGVEFFVSVLLKSWTSVTAATLLTSTTRPLTLLATLRWLRIPTILVAIVMLMYRYLFVLVDEAQRMFRARAARSAAIGPNSGGSIIWRAKIAGGMAGSLFIRTLDRSERIYMAMLARGYDGRIRVTRDTPLRGWAFVQIAVPMAGFVAVAVLARVMA